MPVAGTTDLGGGRSRIRFAQSPRMSTLSPLLRRRRLRTRDGERRRRGTRRRHAERGSRRRRRSRSSPRRRSCTNTTTTSAYPTRCPSSTTSPHPAAASCSAPWRTGARSSPSSTRSCSIPRISTQGGHRSSPSRWRPTRWPTSGSAISSRCSGGTTSGSTRASRRGWKPHDVARCIRSGIPRCRPSACVTARWSATRSRRRHPVVQHVETVEQADQAFDDITYQKGEAVIRMLEGYVGDDAWRAGRARVHARARLRQHGLRRPVARDRGGRQTSRSSASRTTSRCSPGVPLIRVDGAACADGATTAAASSQGEFTKDRPGKRPLRWRVPVIAAPSAARRRRARWSRAARPR